MSKPIFFKAAALTLLTLGLAACGGSDNFAGDPGGGGPVRDSFIAAVNGLIATTSDTIEPREIDSITATSPEDSEPVALDS